MRLLRSSRSVAVPLFFVFLVSFFAVFFAPFSSRFVRGFRAHFRRAARESDQRIHGDNQIGWSKHGGLSVQFRCHGAQLKCGHAWRASQPTRDSVLRFRRSRVVTRRAHVCGARGPSVRGSGARGPQARAGRRRTRGRGTLCLLGVIVPNHADGIGRVFGGTHGGESPFG